MRAASLLLLLALLTGCGRHGPGSPEGGANIPPSKTRLKRNVELCLVKQEKLVSFAETVGYLDAEGQTDIAAGVSGLVEEVSFREGDWVEAGQVLARIDIEKYSAMVAHAEANVKRAEATVLKMKATADRCDAGCRDAEQTLELKKVLLENIRKAGRGARIEERQEAQANVEVASARLDFSKADRSVTKAELGAADKDVDAARAMLKVAQLNKRRSEIRAPYTGQINSRRITVGTYLEDKSIVGTMADLSRLRLVGYIPEKATPMVRSMLMTENTTRASFLAGNFACGVWAALAAIAIDSAGETPATFKLEFELRAFPEKKMHARLFYLSSVANPETHLFECKAEVPTRELSGQLRPGFTAKIRCPLPGRPTSLVIPEEAMRASERGFVVFRPKLVTKADGSETVAEAVPVEPGQRTPGWVEILKGLRPGDTIVQKGAEALEDGTPLQVTGQ
jgi:multidrug efflux system membrane fusion protein